VNWYFDTSVLVAAAVGRHPHNAPALSELEALITGKHQGYVSAHGLTEVYSVLTRTPFNPPFYPS
jgi:predicted nucleic acid-binding protein